MLRNKLIKKEVHQFETQIDAYFENFSLPHKDNSALSKWYIFTAAEDACRLFILRLQELQGEQNFLNEVIAFYAFLNQSNSTLSH